MSVDYAAVLIVGLPSNEFIKEEKTPREVPVFDRRTGQQTGTETEYDYKYTVGNVDLEDDPGSFLRDRDFEFIEPSCYDEDTGYIWGTIVSYVSDSSKSPTFEIFQPGEMEARIKEATESVTKLFKEIGVETPPRVYVVLSSY